MNKVQLDANVNVLSQNYDSGAILVDGDGDIFIMDETENFVDLRTGYRFEFADLAIPIREVPQGTVVTLTVEK